MDTPDQPAEKNPSHKRPRGENKLLREERERRNWTHKDVAELMNLPDSHTVSRWERGVSFPSPYHRRELCRIFGKTVEELGLKQPKRGEIEGTEIEQNTIFYQPPSSFGPTLGRKEDIEAVSRQLLRADVPLLTLIGAGGTGKTRLAIEVAGRIHPHFANGVCFIGLEALRDSSLVIPTIVEALGLQVNARIPLLRQLKSFLKKTHLLLLLDNLEQVVESATELEDLLQDCPNLKVLVTSRQPLAISAESLYEVQPLALPNLAEPLEIDRLVNYSAVDLFVWCAWKVLPDFRITLDNAQAVAELCVRLDGLPLAIELAAAYSKLLTPQELLRRLSRGQQVLKNQQRDIPDRKRTLDHTIDWSYKLLDASEKWLFRRLAVFAGGMTFDIVEQIFQADEQRPEDMLETMNSLLSKCLLYILDPESEERRFGMLETIRSYSLRRLAHAGELDACQREHALYYLDLVEQAAPHLKDAEQSMWLGRLEREQNNLRAALSWLIEQKETGLTLRFCEAFGKYCGLCGYWTEERRWLSSALDLPGGSEQAAMRAKVLRRAAHLAYRLRDLSDARRLFQESIDYARQVDDKATLASALNGLSWVVYRQKEIAYADELQRESLSIVGEANDGWSRANIFESRGRFLYYQGQKDEARTLVQQSITIARNISDKETLVRALTSFAVLEIAQNNMEQARKLALEGFEVARSLKTRPLIAVALDTLGDVAIFEGNYEQARSTLEDRIARARELGDMATVANRQFKLADIILAQGDPTEIEQSLRSAEESLASLREQEDVPGIIDALAILGDLYRSAGDLAQASSRYREALELYAEFGEERRIGRSLSGLAHLLLQQGEVERAAYLYAAIEARRDTFATMHPAQRSAHKSAIEAVRAQLPADDFTRTWSSGSTASLENVLKHATQDQES